MKALKVRIYPNKEQADFLNQQFGAVRMVYNKGLAIIKHRYKYHGLSLNAKKDIKPLLVIAKQSRAYHWLADYDSTALQNAIINLDRSFLNFFKKREGFPRFKNKHGKQSSTHCGSGIGLGEHWIKIGKLKTAIKAKIHRDIKGLKPTSVTITRTTTDKYYASVIFANQLVHEIQKLEVIDQKDIIGLDMGIAHIAIDSNGNKKDNPRFLMNAIGNLKRKQKKFSRKQKGSQSRVKARILLAKCHEKLTNARNDFQHKLTKRITDENQAVIVETLKVKNMIKNRKLAKHIADASWHSLIDKLHYKALEKGKYFIKIDQFFSSSKTCSVCGMKQETLSLAMRSWECNHCKSLHDRDINAAINIKNQGIELLKAAGLSVSAN